tara:strand:- start:32450 stop:32563 length:114 start_codon:yes stop_codon:yes gene_type:complete
LTIKDTLIKPVTLALMSGFKAGENKMKIEGSEDIVYY